MWLGKAAARSCHNLDFYTMGHQEIINTFGRYSRNADISIIEGNKGLYDGLDLDGSNSNAALAKLLGAPVVLIIDARGMTRGIAPLILGYQAFDAQINIAGVILNKLGGRRHESKLRAVIEHYTDVPVLGAILRNDQLEIEERHLGLMPSNEQEKAEQKIMSIAKVIADQVDLDKLQSIAARESSAILFPPSIDTAVDKIRTDVNIGIAKDAAFGFYYPGDLEALETAGAKLIPINTLEQKQLPDIDGLFIGGGFPETQMEALEANTSMRLDIHDAIEAGLPVYAECGGLMYLARSLTWGNEKRQMVGAIPADILMHDAPQGRGYVRLRETGRGLWPCGENQTSEIYAHEFHYSSIENLGESIDFAYEVLRGFGIDGKHDGIIYKNVMANYAHLRDVEAHHWAKRFVEFVRKHKQNSENLKPKHMKVNLP